MNNKTALHKIAASILIVGIACVIAAGIYTYPKLYRNFPAVKADEPVKQKAASGISSKDLSNEQIQQIEQWTKALKTDVKDLSDEQIELKIMACMNGIHMAEGVYYDNYKKCGSIEDLMKSKLLTMDMYKTLGELNYNLECKIVSDQKAEITASPKDSNKEDLKTFYVIHDRAADVVIAKWDIKKPSAARIEKAVRDDLFVIIVAERMYRDKFNKYGGIEELNQAGVIRGGVSEDIEKMGYTLNSENISKDTYEIRAIPKERADLKSFFVDQTDKIRFSKEKNVGKSSSVYDD